MPNLTTCLLCENDHVNGADTNQTAAGSNSTFQGVEAQTAHSSLPEVTHHHSPTPSTDRPASSAPTTATSWDLPTQPTARLGASTFTLTWQKTKEEVKLKNAMDGWIVLHLLMWSLLPKWASLKNTTRMRSQTRWKLREPHKQSECGAFSEQRRQINRTVCRSVL